MRSKVRQLALLTALATFAWLMVATLHTASALADGPGSGTPWVVVVGDSYISGEAGRWAGNTNQSSSEINYNFASIVQTCVEDFLFSPSWDPTNCSQDSSVTGNFSSSNVASVTSAIKGALLNVNQAMTNAGYNSSMWTMLVQDYPSPIPNGSGFRYSQSGYTRQTTGGCGFWNADANWANSTALPTIDSSVFNAASQTGLSNVKTLQVASAFNGRRLCENTVGLLGEEGLTSWTQPGASDKTEWINQVRTTSTLGDSPYQLQEDIHPNYWGQLALRNCLRQAYNGGTPRGGTCSVSGTGLDAQREPNMTLQ